MQLIIENKSSQVQKYNIGVNTYWQPYQPVIKLAQTVAKKQQSLKATS